MLLRKRKLQQRSCEEFKDGAGKGQWGSSLALKGGKCLENIIPGCDFQIFYCLTIYTNLQLTHNWPLIRKDTKNCSNWNLSPSSKLKQRLMTLIEFTCLNLFHEISWSLLLHNLKGKQPQHSHAIEYHYNAMFVETELFLEERFVKGRGQQCLISNNLKLYQVQINFTTWP